MNVQATEIRRPRLILPENGEESKINGASELKRPATRYFLTLPDCQTDVKAPCGFVEDILGES